MAKNNKESVSNLTSIHLTLPICCQICLGKVKNPVVCSNQHVFCQLCLVEWLKKSEVCPTCRTVINEANPFRVILGSLEESMQSKMTDPAVRSKLRRTRMELIFEEFKNEIDFLEDKLSQVSQENSTLKEINEELRLRLEGSNDCAKSPESPDISTFLKLSNKLQDMITVNEELSQANVDLRKEIKVLRNEKDSMLTDLKKIKNENSFISSPQKYNKYAMVALQTKNENYEREIQQWRKALKRADGIIEELTVDLEKFKTPPNTSSVVIDKYENGSLYNRALFSAPSCRANSVKNDNGAPISNNHKTSFLKSNGTSSELLTDPFRFPACSKLIELTKARGPAVNTLQSTVRSLFNSREKYYDEEAMGKIEGEGITVVLPSNEPIPNDSQRLDGSTSPSKRIKIEKEF